MDYNFTDVMKAFNRMCEQYNTRCSINECPIARLMDEWERENDDLWGKYCTELARESPDKFARYVMHWNETHPVPVYPKIGEVVRKICDLMNIDSCISVDTIYNKRLTKEAADYFGIEPINKDKLV